MIFASTIAASVDTPVVMSDGSIISAGFADAAMVTASDCTGDIGAASGVLHIALACMAAAKGYAAGDLAMVHGSSEGGERGAALIDFSR